MPVSVEMPALGESVTEGTVTRWLKKEGDTVEVDEPLLEVSTDKVDTEIPSPVSGVLTKIIASEDDTVGVGGELALIQGVADGDGDTAVVEAPRSAPDPPDAKAAGPEREPAPKLDAQSSAPTPASGETTSVIMPELGESVTEGTVTRWLKKIGDRVEVDEPLVEVSTDKVDTEIPSPSSGTLVSITAAEDATVPIGGELARMTTRAVLEAIPTEAATVEPASPPAPAVDSDAARDAGSDTTGGAPALASTTTPAPTAPPTAPPPLPSPPETSPQLRGTVQKATRIRQLTAKKTHESLLSTAQLTQTHEVDMTRIVALRQRAKKTFSEREGVNLTFLPFIAYAVAEALLAHPNVNASYDEGTNHITYHGAVHLGFAVDTPKGLLSPVVPDAGDKSLAALARAIVDVAGRARAGQLKPDELSGGTFTVTNVGSEGALFDTPILVPPQAAMLATGAIVKRPRVVTGDGGNESIGVRSVCYLAMTYDHRLVDGADAGRFLTTVRRRLEAGLFEADLGLGE
jgi:2-oxoglutarate dehydrogenase E2 component (dihydrolipoamide succinyltransferase)